MAETFAGMEILETLAAGEMGTVYKARQPGLNRIVALKVINPANASKETFARFQREAGILQKLNHPNILRLFKMGKEEGRCYFTMEFVEGEPLSRHIETPETSSERAQFARQVAAAARAIHYAHTQGVVHGGLRPSSIIVDSAGDPHIADFGQALDVAAGQPLARSSGAPAAESVPSAYMAPEQMQGGHRHASVWSDIYSLGAILYEAVTGKAPFQGRTPEELARNIVVRTPMAPRKLNRDAAPEMEAICLKALAKQPRNRQQSAEILADEIDLALLAHQLPSAPPEARKRLRRPLVVWLWEKMVSVGSHLLAAGGRRVVSAKGFRATLWERTLDLSSEIRDISAWMRRRWRAVVVLMGLFAALGLFLIVLRNNSARRAEEKHVPAKPVTAGPEAPRAPKEDDLPARREAIAKVPLGTARVLIDSYYPPHAIRTIAAAEKEVWLVGGGGVYQVGVETGIRSFYPMGLPAQAVACDRAGKIWFAAGEGLTCVDSRKWINYSGKEIGISGRVQAVVADKLGRIWVAGKDSVSCLDGITWKSLATKDGFPSGVLSGMAVDDRGMVWLATQDGVSFFDGARWVPETQFGLLSEYASSIAIDHQGRVWLGASTGVSCLEGQTWKMYPNAVLRRLSGFAEDPNPLVSVAVSADGEVWHLSSRGVYRLSREGWEECEPGRYEAYNGVRHLAEPYPLWPLGYSSVTTDRDGLVWFAGGDNGSGVCCYDGKTWSRYNTSNSGIASNRVRAIAVDVENRKWFATDKGVSCLEGKAWKTYTDADGLAENDVLVILIDKSGRKWFGTATGSVSCYDDATWKISKKGHYFGDAIEAIAEDHEGVVWIGTALHGAFYLEGERWTRIEEAKVLGSQVRAIAIDGQGRKWFATERGICCFDGTTWRRHSQQEAPPTSLFPGCVDREGGIWFAARPRDGVYRFDGKAWKHYLQADGLASNTVHAIAVGPSGDAWFATDKGVSCFNNLVWKTYTDKDGLAENDVMLVVIDSSDRKWFASRTGVSCLTGSTWKTYALPQGGLQYDWVHAIAVDSHGKKWIASWGGEQCDGGVGVSCFDGKAWGISPPLDFDVVAIAADRNGGVWFGGLGGVCRFDGKNWTNYTQKEATGVNAIAVGDNGRVWFGRTSGASVFDGQVWRRYEGKAGPGYVKAVATDRAGRIWFCTSEGVACLENNTWKRYTKKNGLASNLVDAVAVDKAERLWFGTGLWGASSFDGVIWRTYDMDGLASADVHALAVDPGDRKWFGTMKGLVCFDGETWRTWTIKDGLADNWVTCLAVDLDGSIWVGTTTGVSHIVLEKAE